MRKQWRRKAKEETERVAAATEARLSGPPTPPIAAPTLVSPADDEMAPAPGNLGYEYSKGPLD